MAKTVVLKIGGGILRNKDSFDRVVNIVKNKKQNGEKQIIVISALYGVTDFLIDSMSKCAADANQVEPVIISLKKMHKDYLAFISDPKIRQNAEFTLGEKISVLEKFLYGIGYLKEISPRSKDLVQSFGERLSPVVLEAFLLDNKISSSFIDAEEAGIVCKGQFENALSDMSKTSTNLKTNVLPLLDKEVVLLPGYYGVDESGDVKTFGRGGTDYSAGFIANIFEAELEIWKDVSGFMTADPKIVPNAKQIPLLSYEEAEELGYLGAKILHPKTIDPLRQKGLCAEIKDVFHPEVKGTIICADKEKYTSVIKSIASTKDIAVLTIESASMINAPGFAALLFSKLAENEIPVDLIVTSEASISISLDGKKLEKALNIAEEIKKIYPCIISSEKDLSMIGAIGVGLGQTPGVAGKMFGALGKQNINIELISQGASEINISFVVKKSDHDKAILAVHNEFIN
jgi:aspartate kinase